MPNMIPRAIDIDNLSDGEKHVFVRLRQDPDTKGRTVFHSLKIAYHKTRVLGEIDFLVIIPELCIFAIEVKAHRYGRFEQGQDILSFQNWLDYLELLIDQGLSNGR